MNTIKKFYLQGTQANKISGKGFGSKRDCYGYMLSPSLSPLNEKFFAMIFNEVVFNHNKEFKLLAKTNCNEYYNGFYFRVGHFSRNAISTSIVLVVTAHNSITKTVTQCIVKVKYKNGGEAATIQPDKYLGSIKEFNYFGNSYQLADFDILPSGKKEVKQWYYSSYDYKVVK